MISIGKLYNTHKGSIKSLRNFLKNKRLCIDNNNTNSCTLNAIIRIMLNTKLSHFNLNYIRILIDHGAKSVNDSLNDNNTLTQTIMQYNTYLMRISKCDQIKAEKNFIDLIQLLIDNGSTPNTSQSKYNTLNYAVFTKNIDIVKIACKCGARPNINDAWDNSFLNAIYTGNLAIIQEIVIVGGYIDCASSIRSFSPGGDINLLQGYQNPNQINVLLDLMMCSGSNLTITEVNHIMTNINDSNVSDYYNLVNQKYSLTDSIEIKRINDLKIHLKYMMDRLFEKSTHKKNKIKIMEQHVLSHPLCCIDIIFEYQHDSIRYIDWSKY